MAYRADEQTLREDLESMLVGASLEELAACYAVLSGRVEPSAVQEASGQYEIEIEEGGETAVFLG